MFKNLTQFGYKRSKIEALGFYFAYLFLAIIIGGTLAVLTILMYGQADLSFSLKMGTFGSFVMCLVLSFLILKEKRLIKNFSSLIYIVIAGMFALLGGGLLGLIPVAFLTTRKNRGILGE